MGTKNSRLNCRYSEHDPNFHRFLMIVDTGREMKNRASRRSAENVVRNIDHLHSQTSPNTCCSEYTRLRQRYDTNDPCEQCVWRGKERIRPRTIDTALQIENQIQEAPSGRAADQPPTSGP